jgi:hypothetical protein
MKAIDNNKFTHLTPPTFSFASRQQNQKINKLSMIPQKVNYNPINSKSQEKKLENIQKNEK